MATNVLGTELTDCSHDPVTGFYRDGCCNTGADDYGVHTVCAVMTEEFLSFSKSAGNFMTKATAVVATLFIICSLGLTILSRGDLAPTSSVLDTIEEKTEDTPSIPENNN